VRRLGVPLQDRLTLVTSASEITSVFVTVYEAGIRVLGASRPALDHSKAEEAYEFVVQDSITSLGPSVAATLLRIFEEQRDQGCSEVLGAAEASIAFVALGGWNNETAVYELVLSIPPILFARIESQLDKIQKRIESKLTHLRVGGDAEVLRDTRISPQLLAGSGGGQAVVPSAADVSRVWTRAGAVRMFLSHVSQHRAVASKIKTTLASMGIAAFVAHEDVEPTLEWQKEIETALQSMDVLCALLTPEFPGSRWADQEVGFALGRNVPIVAVRLGLDPYGFLAKIQATTGSLQRPEEIAANVFDAAIRIEPLRTRVIDALISAVAEAPTYLDARMGMKKVWQRQAALDKAQIERLLRAARDNSQVKEAFGVADQIGQIARKAGVQLPAPVAQSEVDDDIPF
jgi:TIR domain